MLSRLILVKYVVIFSITILFSVKVSSSCIGSHGTYDLSILEGEWPVSVPGQKGHSYVINLCKPLNISSSNGKCINSSVCKQTVNETVSLGRWYGDIASDHVVQSSPAGGFSVFLISPDGCGDKKKHARSVITFMCSHHLGSPELMIYGDCQANFVWRTSAACKNPPKRREVPCYYIDSEGNKIDLSHLIKERGGHSLTTNKPEADFFINVCSDIVPDGDSAACPANSSLCAVETKSGLVLSFGRPVHGLQHGASLTYEDGSSMSEWSGTSCHGSAYIKFKCRHNIQGPVAPTAFFDSFRCALHVNWETEYACPYEQLKGDLMLCQFTDEDNKVSIDLSPLKKEGAYYTVNGTVNQQPVTFFLNVCGGLDNIVCNGIQWKSVTACMHDVKTNTSRHIGTKIDSELRRADGQIFLTYGNGRTCDSGEMKEKTVINFVCSKDGNETGPQHVVSEDCVHLFEWHTVHACTKEKILYCSADKGGKHVDLERLTKYSSNGGKPWEVFDSRPETNENVELYLNVCEDLEGLEGALNCEPGAAICMKDASGNYTSLGHFESSPVYDSQSDDVILTYTNGSVCSGDKKWHSQITFKCKPGHLMGTPVLLNIDKDECLYELEWYTAAACSFFNLTGSDCSVSNPELGVDFDLNILRSAPYELDFLEWKLYFGICEAAIDSPCANNSDTRNSSFCQVDRNGKIVAAAKANANLIYESGMIQLKYELDERFQKEGKPKEVVIIFACDPGEGKGQIETDHDELDYVFWWFTKHVCIEKVSKECIVHDPITHQFYDLSSLSLEKNNWISYVDEDFKKVRKAFINICRPLSRQPNCDANAAVCIVGEHNEKVVPNAGRVTSRPQISSEGHLQLNYTDGNPCTAFGVKTTYTTVIHFVCETSANPEGNIRFLTKIGACQYSFVWATKAACPTNKVTVKNQCMIADPDTGFVFDLSSLRNDLNPYSVEVGNTRYQLNICGSVKHGCYGSDGNTVADALVSVCEADASGKMIKPMAQNVSYRLSYSKETLLTLRYKNSSSAVAQKPAEVLIRFPCSMDSSIPKLKLVHREYAKYVFEMETHLTCQSMNFDCSFTDSKGNEYDLTPLSRTNGLDWVVSDVRDGQRNFRYHISFCRPLNRATLEKCSGGAIAACRLDVQNPEGEGTSLGTQLQTPEVAEDGTVVLRYTNGSHCENGQFKSSTRITLFCSQVQSNLVFVGRTPECEYLFSLDTPAACPQQISHGADCTVAEPVFGHVFDLTPLRQKAVTVSHGKYKYFITVCGNLSHVEKLPEACGSSAACQIVRNDEKYSKSLGMPSSHLVYDKGVITLKYESGSGNCHGNYNRSTIITFVCDEQSEGAGKPTFMSEAEDCVYLFEWFTKYACPPYDTVECSTEDSFGNSYDLTALGLRNSNYFVRNPKNRNQTFVLNVCKTVVLTQDSKCPYHSGACLLDSGAMNPRERTMNLGRVEQGPYFKFGNLRIKYTNGEPCGDRNMSSAHFMETVINFSCNEDAVASDPEYVGQDDCTYYFDWASAFACPLHQPPPTTASDCSVTDPVTGFKFNLSSLRSGVPYKIQTNNHLFHLNVCGGLKNSPCGAFSGVCQEEMEGAKRHWNAGKPNSDLMLRDNFLLLNYSGGDPCHQNRFERNTIIHFQCGSGVGQPMFLYESSDCTYYFSWVTELACQSLVHCAIINGSDHFSLAPLSNAGPFTVRSTSFIDDSDAVYYIKVCGPLGDFDRGPCPPAASICRVTKNGKYGENLGRVEHPPFVDFSGYATAIYTNGSVCQKNPNEHYRSRIIFVCDPLELLGEPVLISKLENDCVFVFEWKTSIVCPSKPTITTQGSCTFKDEGRGLFFDLSLARIPGSYYEVKETDGQGTYLINVCDNVASSKLDKCMGAGVCYQNGSDVKNYGLASNDFYYSINKVWLTYKDGDDCGSGMVGGKRSAEIFFVCRPDAGIGHPKLYEKYSCLVVFIWETNLVCQNMEHQCTFDFGSDMYDLNLLSSLTHNWNASDQAGNMYYMNLCRGIQSGSNTYGCPPSAAVCMRTRHGSHIPLGMVGYVKAKKMNSSVLVLTYESHSSLACSDLKRSSNVTATTRIFMSCGQYLGSPTYISGPDTSCFYDFAWETNLVCQNDSVSVLHEENGVLKDGNHEMDIKPILNKNFTVMGMSGLETYTYLVNLGGIFPKGSPDGSKCSGAAVCQTKTGFMRDIGSVGTRKFFARRSELFLTFVSQERSCGKNKERNVTSLFRMQCSSAAGLGQIKFLYESGGCDYLFDWDTYVVCPRFHRPDGKKNATNTDNYVDDHSNVSSGSSHKTSLILSLVFLAVIGCYIAFVLSKRERRNAVASKLRSCYSRVTFPRFRYRRCNGENITLVDDNVLPKSPYSVSDDDDNLLL